MTKDSTILKEEQLIKQFQKYLRSGKDLTTQSMYEDTGKIFFLKWETVSHIVQKHYRNLITDKHRNFVQENAGLKFNELHQKFCQEFKYCKREGRFVLGYIR